MDSFSMSLQVELGSEREITMLTLMLLWTINILDNLMLCCLDLGLLSFTLDRDTFLLLILCLKAAIHDLWIDGHLDLLRYILRFSRSKHLFNRNVIGLPNKQLLPCL
jgi:hypothetical protein